METTFTLQSVQKVIGVEETQDTHLLARELAATQEDATLILACNQTTAHAVTGEKLPSGEGGVYFTLILKPVRPIRAEKLSRALDYALGDVLAQIFELNVKQGPQNSVLVWDKSSRSYKKIAVAYTEQTGDAWLLSGVVALGNCLNASTAKEWTALQKILGEQTSKELFLDAVLDNFWKEYAFI